MDGKTEVEEASLYDCEYVELIDNYDVFDLPSTISKLVANRPTNGYTQNVMLNSLGAEKLFNHSITYRLLSNGTTLILHNFYTYKKVAFEFHGFTQCIALDSGKLYIPKLLPISGYDFAKIANWTNAPATQLRLTPDKWEVPTSPPDRFVNFNDNISLHSGYLTDRGVGKLRKTSMLSEAGFLHTSKKIYLFGISQVEPMEAASSYTAVCFRSWTNPKNNPTGRTNYTSFELQGKIYIYLDYHTSMNDSITVTEEWNGKKISIVESKNVTINDDVVFGSIRVNSSANGGYGYVVLMLDN